MLGKMSFIQPEILLEKKHNCYLCNSEGVISRIYNSSDKYEKLIGIMNDTRVWYKCGSCKLMWQTNCLDELSLKDIYGHYRDTSFRNESIEDIFNRIVKLSRSDSENVYRYDWFTDRIGMPRRILDIGSGFGVWPDILSRNGWDVTCIEPNKESHDFIESKLKLKCHNSFGLDDIGDKFDVISLVHVLEHISNPLALLKDIKKRLEYNGRLFVEVPDSIEFAHLEHDHDEFNSTHLFMYNVPSLYTLLSRVFDVIDIHRVHYESRGLYRIMVLCRNLS